MAGTFQPPKGPQTISLRPLNKGIVMDVPPSLVPIGGFLDAKNYDIGPRGVKRRNGVSTYAAGAQVDYPPVRGIISLWATDGTQKTVVIDKKFVYLVQTTGLTGQYWVYDTGTISGTAAGTTVTGLDTTVWTTANDIYAGDVLVIDPGGGAEEEHIIASVTDATHLEIATVGGLEATHLDASNVAYEIRRAFQEISPYLVDWTEVDGKVVFADYQRRLTGFDGSTYELFTTDTFNPGAVVYFRDRVFTGRDIDSSYYRQRLRWSRLADHTDFTNVDGVSGDNTLDLTYVGGAIMALVPLGDILVAYFDDSVLMGRPTSIAGDALPLSFGRLNTGGVGLAGTHGVAEWLDGHFIISQDNIYFLSANWSWEGIGDKVVRDTIRSTDYLWAAWASNDPIRKRILFGFPSLSSDSMTKLWSFDYQAKCWSYSEVPAGVSAFDHLEITETVTWDDKTPTTWAGMAGTTWDTVPGTTGGKKMWLGSGGALTFFGADTLTLDSAQDAIPTILETGDMDFGMPDTDKIALEFRMRLETVLTNDLALTLTGSTDGGESWKSLGTVSIVTGKYEGRVNFRLSGSQIRFKLVGVSVCESYTISEMSLYIRASGREIQID